MSGPDAIHSEMPGSPFPGRPGGEHDEPLLDMIIARRALPPDAPQEMHDLARMLAALAGPGEPGELAPGELAGEAAAWLPSCDWPLRPASRPRPAGRCGATAGPAGRAAYASSRAGLAAAMVAAAAMLGVLAAYAGVLPTVFQQFAHDAVAAPPPRHASQELSPAARSSLAGAGAGLAGPSSQPARSRTSRPDPPRRPASRERPGPGRRRRRDPFTVPPARAACRVQGPSQQPGARVTVDPASSSWWPSVRCSAGPISPTRAVPSVVPYLPRS